MKHSRELGFDDEGRPVLITRAALPYQEEHRARVRKYLTIMAFRVPALLLAAGTPGRRSVLPHARVLLHQPSGQGRGTIPDLTGLPTLQHLDLSVNQLSGTIPPLAGLVTMFYLHLNDNELTGTVPALTTLALLRQFWIGNNRLTGPAPNPPFPDSLIPGQSNLCPNYLTPAATPPAVYDLAWNEATGSTPWSTYCTAPPVTVTNVPTLGEWALALLAMAMGAMAWARRPRAARSDASRG